MDTSNSINDTQCFYCKGVNVLIRGQCGYCSSNRFNWMCRECCVSTADTSTSLCEGCTEHHRQESAGMAENVQTAEIATRPKVVGFTRLPDKFTGIARVIEFDKYHANKRDKRKHRQTCDVFRQIKYAEPE